MKANRRQINRGASKPAPANVPAQHDQTAAAAAQKPLTSEPRKPESELKAPVSTKPMTVQVDFKLFQPKAERVSLCSEFNGWSPEATPMSRCADGQWSVTLGLKPGRYQYKFLVDGEWITDPKARQNLFNQYGTLNSVIEITA